MIKLAFKQLDWVTGEAHGAQAAILTKVTGKCTRIDVVLSSVTDNPTVDVTLTDTDSGGTWASFSTLADGTHHVKLAESHKATQDADFNPVPLCGDNLTVTVDPSADPGGIAQTLTADVILYLEER